MQEVASDSAFVFRYSPRRDTPAAELADQLPDAVKEARNQDLLAVVDDLARANGKALHGMQQLVLCEGPSKTNRERLMGRTPQYKIAIFDGEAAELAGKLVTLEIERTTGFTTFGRVVSWC